MLSRFKLVAGWVTLVASALPLSAQTIGVAPEAGKLRLAVMELNGSALRMLQTQGQMPQGGVQTTQTVSLPPPPEFARTLTEMLTTTLVNTDRFVVLERQQLQALVAEQDLSTAGRVNKETGAATGHIIGAQAMITGDITGYSYTQQSLGGSAINLVRGLKVGGSRVSAQVIIDLRMIDAATGEVLSSAKGTGAPAPPASRRTSPPATSRSTRADPGARLWERPPVARSRNRSSSCSQGCRSPAGRRRSWMSGTASSTSTPERTEAWNQGLCSRSTRRNPR
jgi:hypothetical protein